MILENNSLQDQSLSLYPNNRNTMHFYEIKIPILPLYRVYLRLIMFFFFVVDCVQYKGSLNIDDFGELFDHNLMINYLKCIFNKYPSLPRCMHIWC